MRVAPAVELGPEERARLARWRQGRGPRRLWASIVLLAAGGAQDLEIGARLGVSRQTAARWRARFLAARLRALDRPRGSLRGGRIPEEKLQAIVRSTVGRSATGGGLWSTRRLAREFGVSHMTVRRLWDSYGVRPVRYRPSPWRADPAPPRVPWDVVGVYLREPTAAMLVTLHPRVPASELAPRDLDAPVATAAGVGELAQTASAFRPLPRIEGAGGVRGAATSDLLGFLNDVALRVPLGTSLRVLVTGVPPEGMASLERWRVRHPRFEFELVIDLAAWRESATRELRSIGRGPAPPGQFRGRAELGISLGRSFATFTGKAGSFEWAAHPREITDGEAAYRLRYDLAVTGHPGFKRRPELSPSMTTVPPADSRDRASARYILRQYLRVRPRERVTIESWTATLEYANAFVLESLRLGARPLLLYQDEPTYWAATTEVAARSLASLGEHRKAALERTDVFVSFFGPSDRERFHALPSSTLFRLGEYQDALYQAAAKAGARTVQMAVGRVSPASASMYGVEADAWRAELVAATLVPPQVLRRRARALVGRLTRGRTLEIRHPNGTHLELRLRGRVPRVSDGSITSAQPRGNWSMVTLPAGVVTVALDESFAEGTFRSNVRCSTGLSDSVGDFQGGRWTFQGGRLRQFAFEEGNELFAQSYGRAREGRDRPGSLSIGLNEHIAQAPLLEDQGLGMVGLHIGRNEPYGGSTRTPWWAWLFQRGATVSVDGEPLVKAGTLRA